MKTQINAKLYNFTKKQKGSRRSHGKGNMNHAPADFRRCRNRIYRAKCRQVMSRLITGKIIRGRSGKRNEFEIFKKDAAWIYW